MKKLICLFAIMVFLGVVSVNATDYYVKNGGNDIADGLSDANAWATIGKVNQSWSIIQPGDNILFSRNSIFMGTQLFIEKGGTELNHLVMGAYGIGNKPIIDVENVGNCISFDQSYLTIKDIEVINAGNNGVGGNCINRSDIILDSLTVSHAGNNGIFLEGIDTYTVRDCVVSYCPNNGIAIWGSASNSICNGLVTGNTVHHITNNDGITTHPSDPDCGANHVFTNNHCYACGEQGLDFQSGSNITVTGNTTHDNHSGAIILGSAVSEVNISRHTSYNDSDYTAGAYYLRGTDVTLSYSVGYGTAYHQCVIAGDVTDGVDVYNCTFVRGVSTTVDILNNCSNINFENNILYDSGNGRAMNFLGQAPDTAGYDFDYNCYYSTEGAIGIHNGDWLSLADHQIAYGQEAHSIEADPKFVNVGIHDYRLRLDSPCVGMGAYEPAGEGQEVSRATIKLIIKEIPSCDVVANPTEQTVEKGGATSYEITLDTVGGFNEVVTLSISGVPAGVTATFTSATIQPGESSILGISVAIDAVVGEYDMEVIGMVNN